MANVLNEEKKQQVLALGRLGWSLRRIQQATKIRRETASAYLKAAGIAVRPPSGWGRRAPKPANEVITDSGAAKPAIPVMPDPLNPNPNPKNLSTKTSCGVAAPLSMKIGRGYRLRGSGSVRDTSIVVGDCLEVGSFHEEHDPDTKTDPRRQRYHFLSHPETGRTHSSVCNRPAAQQSPPMEVLCELWWNAVVDWMCIRPQWWPAC
jgi:hypothetical protein